MKLPSVVILGRMNVGKSTLFNRLVESKRAIVSSWPGTTRDVKSTIARWCGSEFELVDTGGFDVEDDEQLEERVVDAALAAIDRSDVVLFVVDGQVGVLPQDRLFARFLQRLGTPVILVINKVDSEKKERMLPDELHQLGFHEQIYVSAGNGRGTGDLLDAVYKLIPETPPIDQEQRTAVAIIGRPNVGKSSLLNAILGEDRVIVADKAHTTRDTNDIPYTYRNKPYLLIDTAGIRKQANVGKRWTDKRLGQIEQESVEAAIRAIKRADVVLMVVEANQGINSQDKKIADLANDLGKSLIIVVNKWDLIPEKSADTINEFIRYFHRALPFLHWAPMIFVSAAKRLRVLDTLDLVQTVSENYARSLTLEELEPIFFKVKGGYKPKYRTIRKERKPVVQFKRLKQVSAEPPYFYFKVNKPKDVPPAITRIIERELRDRFDFDGVKITIETGT